MSGHRGDYQQRRLFEATPSLIASKPEDHWFDRKSFRIKPEALADAMLGFANADGGALLIGVEQDGTIVGIGGDAGHLNTLLQAALQFTTPPVRHATGYIACTNAAGDRVDVLAIEVPPSDRVHRNRRDDVYLRVGDQNRKLGFDAVQELLYDKGQEQFDGTLATGALLSDLHSEAVSEFAAAIGLPDDPTRALRVRNLTVRRDEREGPTWAAALLFGSAPQQFHPGAHIRVLRYEGTESRTGTRSNLTLDVRVEGPLPHQIYEAEAIVQAQVRNIIRLDERTGRFAAVPEIPRLAWLEAVVNAVTHRSYLIQGDHIRVTLFDDRMEIESPGRLPGPVRVDNIRHTRFSRNPRISRTLADLKVVQELNEGIKRMFDEMERAGLAEPLLQQTDGGFRVTLFNGLSRDDVVNPAGLVSLMMRGLPEWMRPVVAVLVEADRITVSEVAIVTGTSLPTARRQLRALQEAGWIERVASSAKDPSAFWRLSRVARQELGRG